jgi:hypothetical protein
MRTVNDDRIVTFCGHLRDGCCVTVRLMKKGMTCVLSFHEEDTR